MNKAFISEKFEKMILRTRGAVMDLKPAVPVDARKYLKKRYKEVCDLNRDLDTAHRMVSRIKNISSRKYDKSKNVKIGKLVVAIKDFRTWEKFFKGTFDESDPIAKMSKKIEAIVNDRNDNHSNWDITNKCNYNNIKYTESKELKSYMTKMVSYKNLFEGANLDCNYAGYMTIFASNILKKIGSSGSDGNTFDLVASTLKTLNAQAIENDKRDGVINEVIDLEGDTQENLENLCRIEELYYWVNDRASDSEVYKMFLKAKKPKGYEDIPSLIKKHSKKILKIYDILHNGNFSATKSNNSHRSEITAARDIRITFMEGVLLSVRFINSGADLSEKIMGSFKKLERKFNSLNISIDSIVNASEGEDNALNRDLKAVNENRAVNIEDVIEELEKFNDGMGALKDRIDSYNRSVKKAEYAVKEKHSKITKAKCIFKIIGGVLGITGQLLDILGALKIL